MVALAEAILREYVGAVKQYGGVNAAARALGVNDKTLAGHIRTARQKWPDCLPPGEFSNQGGWAFANWTIPPKIDFEVAGGTVLVCSDIHAWPGDMPPTWGAFATLSHELAPHLIVLNGDGIDGTKISRHPRLYGQSVPSVSAECDALRAMLDMLPGVPQRAWTVGNHDVRVSNYLANQASELDDWAGTLQDRFPDWPMAYAATINGSVEIRHTFRAGIHGRWNSTLHSGMSTVTGHTHALGVTPMDDRSGRRWGVECGMIASPMAAQFEYTQDSPRRWRAGFAVLTFDSEGRLLPPELAETDERSITHFRGAVVKPRYRKKAS